MKVLRLSSVSQQNFSWRKNQTAMWVYHFQNTILNAKMCIFAIKNVFFSQLETHFLLENTAFRIGADPVWLWKEDKT